MQLTLPLYRRFRIWRAGRLRREIFHEVDHVVRTAKIVRAQRADLPSDEKDPAAHSPLAQGTRVYRLELEGGERLSLILPCPPEEGDAFYERASGARGFVARRDWARLTARIGRLP